MSDFTSKTFRETYRDFYEDGDNYHRVLFNSGRALQARELNEAQTIIQEEIARFGRNIFREGALVKPGGSTIDNSLEYIRLSDSSVVPSNVTEVTFTNEEGLNFVVTEVVSAENGDPTTLYIRYTDTLASTNTEEPARVKEGNVITYLNGGVSGMVVAQPKNVDLPDGSVRTIEPSGRGTRAYFAEGEFFVQGHFVYVEQSQVFLDKYSSTPTVDLGFLIEESIVTEGEDPNLYDNQGDVPNRTSPGAHRYKIKLTPSIRPEEGSTDNFVWVCRIVEGKITREVKTTDAYNVINDLLAVRTKEESGDYVAQEFKVVVEEDGDDLSLDVSEGVAYVDGYRLEVGRSNVDIVKARDPAEANTESIIGGVGSWVEINSGSTFSGATSTIEVDIQDTNDDILGTAVLRGVDRYGSGFRAYLFDVQMLPNKAFSAATSLVDTVDGSLVNLSIKTAALQETSNSNLLFPLAESTPVQDSIQEVSYTARIIENVTADTNGQINRTGSEFGQWILSDDSGILDVTTSDGTYSGLSGSYTLVRYAPLDGQRIKTKVLTETTVDLSVGTRTETTLSPAYVPNGSNNNYFFYNEDRDRWLFYLDGTLQKRTPDDQYWYNLSEGSSIEWNGEVYIVGAYDSVNSQPNNDREFYAVKQVTVDDGKYYQLTQVDGVELKSVSYTTDEEVQDATFMYNMDGGQRDNFYDFVSIQRTATSSLPSDVTSISVTFTHYVHSTDGVFFAASSYKNSDNTLVAYDDVPSYTTASGETLQLRSVLDFRPTKTSATEFTTLALPQNNSAITIENLQYHRPRIDTLVANIVTDENTIGIGEVKLIQGQPAPAPKAPILPAGTLPLYNVEIGAYTFSRDDVRVNYIPNKRFTMKDIAALEERVDTLFELTTLSLLEQDTNSILILDDANLPRTKTGFIADNFSGFSFSDVFADDYRASIETFAGELKPSFREQSVRLQLDPTQSSLKKGDLVTLPFSHEALIEQKLATSTLNVNPFAVITQTGHMVLSPASDEWVETRSLPDIIQTTVRRQSIDLSSERARRRGRTVTTTTTRTIQEFVGQRVVDIEIIPFMRSREVSFSVKGLRPNTRMFPYFGNKSVSEWVRQEPFTQFSDNPTEVGSEFSDATSHPRGSSDLVTDAKGELTGNFFIPNTSAIQFRTGTQEFKLLDISKNDDENSVTNSRAVYTSVGTIETIQRTIRSTRIITTITRDRDPLAQTFRVDRVEHPNGLFLSKVDVYVKTKDSTIPLQVQIRPVENGVPTGRILPGSVKFTDPADINLPADPEQMSSVLQAPTSIEFDEPVYLTSGEEYAIVLLAESIDYNVYVAETYEFVLGSTDAKVAKQPTLGSLFLSQNGSTWTPDQTKDLMFNLYRAKFPTDNGVTVNLTNTSLPKVTLGNNPIETTVGSSDIKIHHEGHGFSAGDSVTISGVTNGLSGILPANINGTFVVKSPTWQGYSIDTTVSATATGTGGGSNIKASQQVMYDEFTPLVQFLAPTATSISSSISTQTGQSYGQNRRNPIGQSSSVVTTTVNLNNLNLNDQPMIVRSNENEAGSRTLTLNISLSTNDDSVSPVIDMQRASVLALENVIDKVDAAQHVTIPVVLENASDGLKVIFAANRPIESEFEVYVKRSLTEEGLNTAEWVAMNREAYPVSDSNRSIYRDYEYVIENAGDETFSAFQVKVVMTSSNSSKSPTIRDLRAIALV